MDWLKRFFTEPGTLVAIVSSGVIGLITGIASGVIQRKHGGWPGFLSSVMTGVAVSIIVGLGISDYVHSETFRLAIIGACAVVADDIWAGIQTLGQGLRTDPLGTTSRLIDALRGKSASSPANGKE